MKYARLILLPALLWAANLAAQDWLPVLPGEIQHYRLGNTGHITHSIRIDSVKSSGPDSVYYLNRVLERLYIPAFSTPPDSFVAPLREQGQFLGQTMTRKADGSLVFKASRTDFDTAFTIWPQAGPGESWVAIQPGQVMATVESVTAGTVLGEPDSLKVIRFGNGATWVLSQKHGLVSCPDWKSGGTVSLSGLESRQLGDRLYRLEDFFDFQPGDVLEYEDYSFGLFGWIDFKTKNTILQKSVTPDGYAYWIERKRHTLKFAGHPWLQEGIDTFWWNIKRSDFPHLSRYPGELFPITDGFFSLPEQLYSVVSYTQDGLLLGAQSSYAQDDDEAHCPVLTPPTPDSDPLLLYFDEAVECTGQHYEELFQRGLGRTAYRISVLDNAYSAYLRGAVIQGDTIGTLTPDWVFTGVETPGLSRPGFFIYPNPARLQVNICFKQPVPGVLLRIFSVDGLLIRQLEPESQASSVLIDLTGVPSSIYYCSMTDPSGKVLVAKFCVVH